MCSKFFFPTFYKKIKTVFSEKVVTPVPSAHDVGSLKGLQLKNNLSTFETVQLINGSLIKPNVIKSKLPWHVIGTVAFVIDSDSLENRLDNGTDAWRRDVYKPQTPSTAKISQEARYSLCDRLEERQIAKPYYKCTDNLEFKRQIFAIYPKDINVNRAKTSRTSTVVVFWNLNIYIIKTIQQSTGLLKRSWSSLTQYTDGKWTKKDIIRGYEEIQILRKHPKSISSRTPFTGICRKL